jgi:hypothetical protein
MVQIINVVELEILVVIPIEYKETRVVKKITLPFLLMAPITVP